MSEQYTCSHCGKTFDTVEEGCFRTRDEYICKKCATMLRKEGKPPFDKPAYVAFSRSWMLALGLLGFAGGIGNLSRDVFAAVIGISVGVGFTAAFVVSLLKFKKRKRGS